MQDRPISTDTREEDPEALTKITKVIGPLIAATAERIFLSHAYDLMTGPIDYIVPAVWGEKKDGELDDTQRKINIRIETTPPFVRKSPSRSNFGQGPGVLHYVSDTGTPDFENWFSYRNGQEASKPGFGGI